MSLAVVHQYYCCRMKDYKYLELIAERLIIEKYPRILIFVIPMIFELPHTLDKTWQFRVTDQADQGSVRFGASMADIGNRPYNF